MEFKNFLIDNTIIAAVRDEKEVEAVAKSNIKIVFVIESNLLNIKNICEYLKKFNKIIFLHVDMISGLKSDEISIKYIKRNTLADGIITTKFNNIKFANKLNLLSVLRIFILDSKSIYTGIKNINSSMPTAVELMPALIYKAIDKFTKEINLPIIAGGLIETEKEASLCLESGAKAVSTSNSQLWK